MQMDVIDEERLLGLLTSELLSKGYIDSSDNDDRQFSTRSVYVDGRRIVLGKFKYFQIGSLAHDFCVTMCLPGRKTFYPAPVVAELLEDAAFHPLRDLASNKLNKLMAAGPLPPPARCSLASSIRRRRHVPAISVPVHELQDSGSTPPALTEGVMGPDEIPCTEQNLKIILRELFPHDI